ncbi:MAG: RsmB/NOP family class I SAM-dependent RNA methyltransferase, partial [Planctomycetota bacterium]
PTRDDPAAFCEIVLSHPRPIVDRLIALLGPDDAIRFCEHNNREAPLLARLIGDATVEQLVSEPKPTSERSVDAGPDEHQSALDGPGSTLRSDHGFGEGLSVRAHEQEWIVVIDGARASDIARWSDEGLCQPQDATSAAVVPLLGVEPGQTVLDRCCGVGTKTQQLSEAAGETGRVFAVDSHGARISTLRKLAKQRPSMGNVTAKRAEWSFDFPDDWPERFDHILIDAPCSNSGVLARRANARYAQTDEAELRDIQSSLLDDVWPLLAEGGRVVYATCSVWPEENDQIVDAFVSRTPGVTVVDRHTWLPSFETDDPTRYRDGGYAAVLERA